MMGATHGSFPQTSGTGGAQTPLNKNFNAKAVAKDMIWTPN
jgi:hypothetical protein